MYALDGPVFLRMAFRLPAYEGCMRARLEHQHRVKAQLQQQPAGDGGGSEGELTEEEVEQLRNQARIRGNPKALRQGEQPQYVPIDQLVREST